MKVDQTVLGCVRKLYHGTQVMNIANITRHGVLAGGGACRGKQHVFTSMCHPADALPEYSKDGWKISTIRSGSTALVYIDKEIMTKMDMFVTTAGTLVATQHIEWFDCEVVTVLPKAFAPHEQGIAGRSRTGITQGMTSAEITVTNNEITVWDRAFVLRRQQDGPVQE